ncbi:MAG: type II toxin-antitoxin system RelE/ParE family toxin [Alkaliphilus sp.]
MHKLRISPTAKRDLVDIKEYITKELSNPTSAIKVVSRIAESLVKLKEFPMLGGELSAKVDILTNYRYLISGNYIIFYKADEKYVSIYRILYAKRDYNKILFKGEKFEMDFK